MLTISIAGYASLAIAAHASNPKSVQEFAEQYMAAFNKGDREALKRLRYPSTDKSDMQEIMDEIAEAEMAAGTKYNKFEVLPLDGKKSEPVVGPDGVVYEPNLPPTNVLKFIAKTETGSTSMTFPIGVKDGVYYQVAIVPSKGEQPAFKFGWQRFTPPKADWSVLLPNEPEPGIAALEMQVGRAGLDDPDLYGVVRNTASIKTTQHFFQCGAEGKRIHASDSKEKFRVARTTYAPETLKESFSDPKKTLDETVDLRTRSLPGKLVNVRDIELGGSPGREFEIRGEDGTYCLGRVYWIKDTLYELTFESKGEKPDMAAANKFLSSLEVN
jgi:hypothetical protein